MSGGNTQGVPDVGPPPRTAREQDVSFELHGDNHYERFIHMAAFADRLENEVAAHQRTGAWCDKHKPGPGARANCLVCALEKLSQALSRISYACEPKNEMECSSYDVHCDHYEAHEQGIPCPGRCAAMLDKAGADWDEWPEDLRVREWPALEGER